MVQVKTLPVFLCVMGLLSETLCSLTLEAEVGDKVTIWCQHDLTDTGYIYWFKQIIGSVPLRIGCKKLRLLALSETCYFFTESERIVMFVHDKNTSLTITAVNVSDTGLYYCGYMEQVKMIFSNSTSLQVKDVNVTISEDQPTGCISPAVFFMLTVGFGAVSVILLIALILFILGHRKAHTGAATEDNKAGESVHYSALHFSKMKTRQTKRYAENMDPSVIYSSVAQNTHTLQYLYTALTPRLHFPQFSAVGLVDGEQCVYYDSHIRKMIPQTEKIEDFDPRYWDRETRRMTEQSLCIEQSGDLIKVKHIQGFQH